MAISSSEIVNSDSDSDGPMIYRDYGYFTSAESSSDRDAHYEISGCFLCHKCCQGTFIIRWTNLTPTTKRWAPNGRYVLRRRRCLSKHPHNDWKGKIFPPVPLWTANGILPLKILSNTQRHPSHLGHTAASRQTSWTTKCGPWVPYHIVHS